MKKYHICLWAYAPREEKAMIDGESVVVFAKGDVIGGKSRYVKNIQIEDAINIARDMWLEWVSENKGTQIEVWIQEYSYPPKVGTFQALFHRNNFDKFKIGSKEEAGTPF